ncbi:MAG: transporter [Glaciihabitans sp.]|nr:transporter [Glaciihabitans sp.]
MTGSRSIARFAPRVGALLIDWGLSVLISWAFFDYDGIATLLIFVITQIIFVLTTGASIGHRLLGLRVASLDGKGIGIWRPFVRAALIAIVIPAVIWDRDERGMHDRLIGTVLLRR